MLVFKTLEHTLVTEIVETMTTSFADYFVKVPDDVDFWKNRWKTNRVRYDLSIGTFDNNNLIAFMVIGVDKRNGKRVAFNAGTGVIPQYRGQRLVKQMYDFAIPIFKENGIDELALEVITKNIKAIKAYQSVGFKVDKLYQCFQSKDINFDNSVEYSVTEVTQPNWKKYEPFTKEAYCWEFLEAGININIEIYRCFELYDNSNNLIAYYIINPNRNTIMRFEAVNEIGYKTLFHHWHFEFKNVRIINVQHPEKINFLNQNNFENNINQFEMVGSLSS